MQGGFSVVVFLSDVMRDYFLLILFSSSLREAVHHDGSQKEGGMHSGRFDEFYYCLKLEEKTRQIMAAV